MRCTDIDRAIAAIADDHHGLVTNHLTRAAGIPADRLVDRCRSRSLIRLDQGLYRTADRPVTWHQRLLAALWRQGPHAAASHRSAAILHGLGTVGDWHPIELIVPRWDRRVNRSNAWLHESKDLAAIDLTTVAGIQCTTLVRTLIDIPAVVPEHRARLLYDEAFHRGLCPIEEVTDRFVQIARRGRNGTRIGRSLLEQRLGVDVPTMSEFEARVATLIERAGMPALARQVPVRTADSTVYVDLGWTDLKIGIGCTGLTRSARAATLRDQARETVLADAGWLVVGLTWEMVTMAPAEVVGQVRMERQVRLVAAAALLA